MGSLTPDAREATLQQDTYWRKMQGVAEQRQTEVRLSLPGQRTAKGTPFTVEGVVDIVEDAGRTVMYDIKTHNADDVRDNLDQYCQQLNVYTHIWRELRGEPLDEASVIATDYPPYVCGWHWNRGMRSSWRICTGTLGPGGANPLRWGECKGNHPGVRGCGGHD